MSTTTYEYICRACDSNFRIDAVASSGQDIHEHLYMCPFCQEPELELRDESEANEKP